MKIFVFGNINAGKSYSIRKIKANHFKDYPILSIDEYRKKYEDNTYEKEMLSQKKFVDDVFNTKDCIVECTGLGPLGKKLHDKQLYKNDVIIYVNTPVDICIDRIKDKDFSIVPYPPVEEKMECTITRCAKEFSDNKLYDLWIDKILQIFEVKKIEDIAKLPLETISTFSNIIDFLFYIPEINTIYTYGSLARNEMRRHSDIDCFIVSDNLSPTDILGMLKGHFSNLNFDHIGKKVTVRKNDELLIEFVVIKKLSNGERYIRGSNLSNLCNSIIKINDLDKKYIDNLVLTNDKPIDSVDYLISELVYFVKSLPKIIEENDRYKYYFHFNIIVHNYRRVNEIFKGNVEYNYLPRVDYDEYKELIELDKSDLNMHYIKTKELVKKMLEGHCSSDLTKYF